jgi:hypothetical protein
MSRPIYEIAADIERDWGSKVNYAARPYLDAMHSLRSARDNYGADSGESVVIYFLSNATGYRGPTARRLKDELKVALKAKGPLRGARLGSRRTSGRLGASAEVHRGRADQSAAVARGAMATARSALQRGDCETAWASITHAAENIGAMAAHSDSGGASRIIGNRLGPNDAWGEARATLLDVMAEASTCLRRRK